MVYQDHTYSKYRQTYN